MADKSAHPGWVVRVATSGPAPSDGAPPERLSKYFNVAIADPVQAVEATRKYSRAPEDATIEPVRVLTAKEVASIPLKAGEVKPA
jgi:hypothetical protein